MLSLEEKLYNLHEYGINPDSREIFLHSYLHVESGAEIDAEPGMDYRMASTFIKNMALLSHLNSKKPILVHQCSVGGDWNYGMSIYDAIKASVAPVTVLAYGHARSMSSITLQAAKKRVLMPNCDVLIHHGTLGFSDRAVPILSNVEHWKNVEMPTMINIYARRCYQAKFWAGQTVKQVETVIRERMEKKVDWIMTPKQAIHYGFADGILGTRGFQWKDLK